MVKFNFTKKIISFFFFINIFILLSAGSELKEEFVEELTFDQYVNNILSENKLNSFDGVNKYICPEDKSINNFNSLDCESLFFKLLHVFWYRLFDFINVEEKWLYNEKFLNFNPYYNSEDQIEVDLHDIFLISKFINVSSYGLRSNNIQILIDCLSKTNLHYACKVDDDSIKQRAVIGDLHGNIQDFFKIIKKLIENDFLDNNLKLNKKKLIFLGDFIGRGNNSLEVLLLIIILKLLNFEDVIILKGNHEALDMNICDGFLKELSCKIVKDKNGKSLINIYRYILGIFNYLPEAVYLKIADKVIQLNHGGFNFEYNPKYLINGPKIFQHINFSTNYSPNLWHDILYSLNRAVSLTVRGDSLARSSIDVLSKMQKFGVDYIIKGHQHEIDTGEVDCEWDFKPLYQIDSIIEKKYKKREQNYKIDGNGGNLGFCDIGNIGEYKKSIFVLISAAILSGIYLDQPCREIDYAPSYLNIDVDQENKLNFTVIECN
ncbi:MAG: Serine/threonine-protein phosphatase [candidate division TM6 bacterium GW2011_GWF2_28_16]|nr:MAG: Serine/threonine-protein phosphatase [candidate division TM6 bacterium GW2011_GWF2_28_16]